MRVTRTCLTNTSYNVGHYGFYFVLYSAGHNFMISTIQQITFHTFVSLTYCATLPHFNEIIVFTLSFTINDDIYFERIFFL